MKKILQKTRSGVDRGRSLRGIFILFLLGFMIPATMAQVTSYDKYIFVSGQITESISGAPIAGHDIYIFSDSLTNNGFGYYAVAKTDINGFYWDTIVTNQNTGILNLSLYDFEQNLISLDRYYRFVWENNFQMFVDFSIFDPNSTTDFQANFRPEEDTLGNNPMKVLFRDQSIGSAVKSWDWDFGDGTTSNIQDPEHVYEQPGNYLVSLTITSLPPEFEPPDKSTITKQVQVGLTQFYDMGGHVFADYFPIDFGLAYLYAFDVENNLVPIDTAVIDTLGYYWFYQVPEGKYITKARLQGISGLYGQFVPTYFGNSIDWTKATALNLDNNNFECDITLIPSMGVTSGNGQIIGQVSYDTVRSSSSIIPAGEVEILLLSETGASLTCGLSDMEGFFRFAGIAYGTYKLYPDVAGIQTHPMTVTITEENPTVNDITLVISPEQAVFSVPEIVSAFIESTIAIYPNPVSDQARISIDMKKSSDIEILVVDVSGRNVYREKRMLEKGKNYWNIDAGNFAAGCYQVIIVPEDKVTVTGKLLKFN